MELPLVVSFLIALSVLQTALGDPLTELSVPERPEGIAKGPGSILYVSQITSGKVLAIDVVTGETTEVVGEQTDRQAWGLWYLEDQDQGYLFVAGGGPSLGTGQPEIYLYQVDTGDSILACSPPPSSHNETGHGVFLNDVAVLNGVAYVTNSFSSKLLALDVSEALAGNCSIQEIFLPQEFVPLHPGDWGTNGIAPYQLEMDDGTIIQGLFVSNEQDGTVFSLQFSGDDNTPRYQKIIGLAGALGADGLVFDNTKLYVTQNTMNRISVYNISADGIGALYSERIGFITSDDYDAPATCALYDGYIYSTNSRLIEQPNLAQEPDHNNVIGVQNPFATSDDHDEDTPIDDETEEQDGPEVEDTAETPGTSEEEAEGEGEVPELSSSSCLGQESVVSLALVMAMALQSTLL